MGDFPVGSEQSVFSAAIVDQLNKIFNEHWDVNDIVGALNGAELIVNTMAHDLTNGVEAAQLRVTALQIATTLTSSSNGTATSLVANASAIENYVKNGASKP
jgi:hypothetical protein